MTSAISLDARALERFDVPVIRVGFDAKLRYANQAALDLAGLRDYNDVDLAALLAEPEEWQAVQRHLQTRAQGEPASYPIKLRRADDGRILPVKVYAIPEVGPDGSVIGSMAFVTNEHEARISQAMHKSIERTRSSKEILDQVHELLRQLVDYDSLRVSAISKSRKHLCQLYCSMPEPKSYRWWRIQPHVAAMIDDDQPKNIDVDELFSRPGFAAMRSDPATAIWLRYGFKNLLSIPVKRGKRVVAWLSLETTRSDPFPKSTFETCARLPLIEAVLMALHYEESRRRDVVIELIQELTKRKQPDPPRHAVDAAEEAEKAQKAHKSEIQRAADILVQKLASEFEWEHVSIFRHDEENDRLRPLSQASEAGLALKDDFSIASDEGLVGEAFTKQKTINAGDVRQPPYKGVYREGVKDIISELCVPVPGSRSRWVVNIESKLENAFAEEEVETVEMLVQEAGSILDRTAMLEMREAVLASIKDGVLETDRRGEIREANGAAAKLLRVARKKLRGRRLSEFFADGKLKTAIESGESFSRRDASLMPAAGDPVEVLISGALLPEDLGGKVFVISDLSYAQQIRQLDLINEVFRQAALESRVPLAIAVAGVRELGGEDPKDQECRARILQQLRKVDLPLERLLHLATTNHLDVEAPQLVDLREIVNETLKELPESERGQVEVSASAGAMVHAPRQTLSFCLETMLSFALRTRPQDQKVHLNLLRRPADAGGEAAQILVQGDWRPVIDSDRKRSAPDHWRRRAITDLALGEAVLKRVAQQAGGDFHWEAESALALDLMLPVSEKQEVRHG